MLGEMVVITSGPNKQQETNSLATQTALSAVDS